MCNFPLLILLIHCSLGYSVPRPVGRKEGLLALTSGLLAIAQIARVQRCILLALGFHRLYMLDKAGGDACENGKSLDEIDCSEDRVSLTSSHKLCQQTYGIYRYLFICFSFEFIRYL